MKKEFTQTVFKKIYEGSHQLGIIMLQKFHPIMVRTATDDECESGKCSCSFHTGDCVRIRETRSGGFEYLSGNIWKMLPAGRNI